MKELMEWVETMGVLGILLITGIVMVPLNILLIALGFQVLAITGFIVLFAVAGAWVAMPFIFGWEWWRDRGLTAEDKAVRSRMQLWGVDEDEAKAALEREGRGKPGLSYERRWELGLLDPVEQGRQRRWEKDLQVRREMEQRRYEQGLPVSDWFLEGAPDTPAVHD